MRKEEGYLVMCKIQAFKTATDHLCKNDDWESHSPRTRKLNTKCNINRKDLYSQGE